MTLRWSSLLKQAMQRKLRARKRKVAIGMQVELIQKINHQQTCM